MTTGSENSSDSRPTLSLTRDERKQIDNHGRWLRRVCHPFHSFESIMSVQLNSQEGSQRLVQPNTREYYTALSNVQRNFRVEDANSITTHLPFITARMALPTTTAEEITEIARKVQKKAGGGKDTDCKNMKRDVINLIPPEYLPDSGGNGSLQNVPSAHIEFRNPEMHKAWRGFENPITARLLCPINHLEKMKVDPEGTQESLKAGTLPLKDREHQPFFPVFLYDEQMTDARSLTKGLLRGPLLLKAGLSPSPTMATNRCSQAYRSIFLGRSHADGVTTKTKGGNAHIHGMLSVKPSSICYTAIQVYVALSAMEKWGISDDTGVNLSTLYDLLREQFQDPDDPWYKETLKWWDNQVFPDTPDDHDPPGARDMEGPTMRERLAQEQVARTAQGGSSAADA